MLYEVIMYAWIVWRCNSDPRETRFTWIPPCRKRLERDTDYTPTQGA